MTDLDIEKIKQLSDVAGEAFYVLDSGQFRQNFCELKRAFADIYPYFNIAYSYKTNYTPKLCKIIDELDGYAEVVSDMEMEIALRIGVKPEKIIWNGPYKNSREVEKLLCLGGTVNLDSEYEINMVKEIAHKYPDKTINIGIRCNFEINDGVLSRFGFDVNGKEFIDVLLFVKDTKNVHLRSLQLHYAARNLDTWEPRAIGMLKVVDSIGIIPDCIDLGGGLFGKMEDSLKEQFNTKIPSYKEYANNAAAPFRKRFSDSDIKPMLMIEPGSALVGDCMKFVTRVVNIKCVRGKNIATLYGSMYNINPTLSAKNLPIKIYSTGNKNKYYSDLDFGGYTCIESDYLYRHFSGNISVGDIVVFSNVGSYSIVLKPPFIMPNFPVLDVADDNITIVKQQESFNDLFHTFCF